MKKKTKITACKINGLILTALGLSLFAVGCASSRIYQDNMVFKTCIVERDQALNAIRESQLNMVAADRDLGNSAQEFKTLREEIVIWQKRYTLLSIQHRRALKGIDQQQCRIQELTDGHKHSCDDEGGEPW